MAPRRWISICLPAGIRTTEHLSTYCAARFQSRQRSVPRQSLRLGLALLIALFAREVPAQFYATCREATVTELDASIRAHDEHSYRLHTKFVTGWYHQGKLPGNFQPIERRDIVAALAQLRERRAAVLFQAYQDGRFCSWLISPHTGLVAHRADLVEADLRRLQPRLVEALGIRDRGRGRLPERKQLPTRSGADSDEDATSGNAAALKAASAVLLPQPVREALVHARIDTLVVVPVFETGTVPFAALPLDDSRLLLDVASVMVAPGLFVFREPPRVARSTFPRALVVGNPIGWQDPDWKFSPLPGAEQEAKVVAARLGTAALLGTTATKQRVTDALVSAPTLIYLATHGIADDTNPLDAGFLLLSDGRWPAREIAEAPIAGTRPLVVMSACQSGLGKHFEVGTIGLARAWHQAGASNVVMSLWNVGDESTPRLMAHFARMLTCLPPDRALREAMLAARSADPDPGRWAGFAVFGLPELPQP